MRLHKVGSPLDVGGALEAVRCWHSMRAFRIPDDLGALREDVGGAVGGSALVDGIAHLLPTD